MCSMSIKNQSNSQFPEGRDLTLIATGGIVQEALIAAEELHVLGIDCRVVSMHTLNPIDIEMIKACAQETAGIITIEEHTVVGGLGGAVAEACLETRCSPNFFFRVGLRGGFSSVVGSQSYLRRVYHMDASAIVEKVMALYARNMTSHKRTIREQSYEALDA